MGASGVAVCAGALVGAIGWNLLTWWRGLPSSSSHALIGGLCGAALAAGATVKWDSILDKRRRPDGALAGARPGRWFLAHDGDPLDVPSRGARADGARVPVRADRLGGGDGVRARHAGCREDRRCRRPHPGGERLTGRPADLSIPWWAIALSAVVLSLGTYAGGWRIMRTLGRRIVDVDPPHGFAAETTAAAVLYAATATGAPISTTHAITSAIMGVGSTRSHKAVRWGVARSIVIAWVLTFPGAGLAAAAAYAVLTLLITLTSDPRLIADRPPQAARRPRDPRG